MKKFEETDKINSVWWAFEEGENIMEARKKVENYSVVDDKGTWTVRARVYDPKINKVRLRSKTTGIKAGRNNKGKRQAERIAMDIIARWEREANALYFGYDSLFSEYVERFLEKKSISRTGNTVESYRDYAKRIILPFFGNIKIVDVSRRHLERFVMEMAKDHSTSSIKKYFAVIRGSLLEALRDGVIERDFWSNTIEFPRMEKHEKQILSPEQATALLKNIQNEPEPMRSAVILGLCYGLRREEVCGLRWVDIDFSKNEMHIRNTVTQRSGQIWEDVRTKTDSSYRTLILQDSTIPYFQRLRAEQMGKLHVLDKVCAWSDGRKVQPDYISAKFPKILEKYGLPRIRFHDLRHTAGSLLLSRLPMFQVKEFLGHEDISTTVNIYGSLLDKDRKEASQAMNKYYADIDFCKNGTSESRSESCSETAFA